MGKKQKLLTTCAEYKTLLDNWGTIKQEGEEAQQEWRLALSTAIRRCREEETGVGVNSIPDDCDPDELIGLASILGELAIINKEERRVGGKMVGGALYDQLVAQLSALAGWLQGHAGHISNCAKWFLQKIWSAATLAAQAIVRAGSWGAGVASTVATIATDFATSAPGVASNVAQAGAEVTGITDMLALVENVIYIGDAALKDMYDTALGAQDTITFGFAVRALVCVISPLSPYVDAINTDINRIMTDNMGSFNTIVGNTIPTAEEFGVMLSSTSIPKKLYLLSVSLQFAKTIPFFTRAAFTALIATGNAARYFGPMCWSVFNSNIFTVALLSHASFYALNTQQRAAVLTLYNRMDEYMAGKITTPDQLKEFKSHIDHVLNKDSLKHFRSEVGLKQRLVQAKTRIATTQRLIEYNEIETRIAEEIQAAISTADRLEAELAQRIASGAGAGSVIPMEDGNNAGGSRSTRKRGMNKKGGAKSKRSPKSTRKGGRKQSARKIR